ncbi:MAG: hypothetical protein Tsb0014_35390 [Pleurocapsa sp.]
MMTQIEKIKYLKLVNYLEKNQEEWAYEDITLNQEFELHWQSSSEKVTQKHKTNANKARKGDLILLFQNHKRFGHRMTHIVEIANNKEAEYREYNQGKYIRIVKALWISDKGYNNAPETQKVVGEFKFRDGFLISINARTVELNYKLLNQLMNN